MTRDGVHTLRSGGHTTKVRDRSDKVIGCGVSELSGREDTKPKFRGRAGRMSKGESEDDHKPDGGWGWIVMIGVFIVFVITTGSSWAFGILYIAFLDAFGLSKAITAVPGSLIFMLMVVTNPYAGRLADKYGHRPVIFVGGVVSTLAIFASSFVEDFITLTVLYGLIGGIGFGLSHLPAVVMLNHYFDKRIGTATGIAMAGTGFGTIFMSVITQFLLKEYGWRGTMLVLSAINANLCVAAAVMRPISKTRRRRVRVDDNDDDDAMQVVRITSAWSSTDVNYNAVPQDDNSDLSVSITSNPLDQMTSSCSMISSASSAGDGDSEVNQQNKVEHELPVDDSDGYCTITSNPIHQSTSSIQLVSSRPSSASDNVETSHIDHTKAHGHIHSAVNYNNSNGATEICVGRKLCNEAELKAIEAEDIRETPSRCLCVRRGWRATWSFFDSVYGFDLWKSPRYLSFLMGIMFAFFGFTLVSAHVAKRALEFGIPEYYSSSLVAVMGLSQAAGRFFTGPLIDRCRLNPMKFYQAMSATCGVAIIVSIYLPSFPAQACFCAVAGYTTGACATLQTVMSGALFGKGQMKFAYSGVILVVGVAMLCSPTLGGLCRDIQESYVAAFYVAAAACLSSVVAHFPLVCTIKPGKRLARTRRKSGIEVNTDMDVKV